MSAGASSSEPTFSQRAATVEDLLSSEPLIRAVNFHNTSHKLAHEIEKQLSGYAKYFGAVNEDDLDGYLKTGEWHKPKPGLIISVFEGYRSGYDVMAPLLEKYGFTGWYFIITKFLDSAVKDQLHFADTHDIDMETHEYPDGRYALTWEQVRELSKKHVIASHARSHTQLSKLDRATVRSEVLGSQEDFEKHLGRKVRSFVSLTGPAYGENPYADQLIREAGYDFVFSNFAIHRVHATDKT